MPRMSPAPHSPAAIRILGLDPGLQNTGWGVVDLDGSRLRHVADGTVRTDRLLPTARRLQQIFGGLMEVIASYHPGEAAVEETFVNKNGATTLKLGLARGAVLLAPAQAGLEVAEYATKFVKKAVVGVGGAGKPQVEAMVRTLLPGVTPASPDASDALAVAICHAHYRSTRLVWQDAAAAASGVAAS